MIIENISHACLKYHFKNYSLITDPWIVDQPIKSYMIYKFPSQKQKNFNEINSKVRFCYISHTHEDHFHIPSLKKLNKNIRFLIPDFAKYNNLRRANVMHETLKKLGFKKITLLTPWKKKKLSKNFFITLVPSAKTRYFDWENSGLAITYRNKTILNMNDNVTDKDLLKNIKNKIGKIFIYFVQTAGISIHPACFSYSKNRKKEIIKNKTNDFKLHKEIIDHIRPEYLIPYAGDFGWFGSHEDYNFWSRLTPLPLLSYLQRKGIKTFEFNPSDQLKLNKKLTFIKNNHINWKNYTELINEHKKIYKNQIIKKNNFLKKHQINQNLLLNSKKYINSLNKINSKSNALPNFNARICYCIKDKSKNKILFYILVDAKKGEILKLSISRIQPSNVYQVHFLDTKVFSLILKGKIMLSECQWSSEIKQIKKFDINNRDLLFFIGYHIDGDNRTPELKLRKIYSVK
jgi:hypothetical protein